MKELKTFTIKRSKWARGGKNGDSMLLNHEGGMCCLGFLAKSAGISKKKLEGTPSPSCLIREGKAQAVEVLEKLPKLVTKKRENSELCGEMMSVNDNNGHWDKDGNYIETTEEERESKLTKLFAKIGWKPRFINILIVGAMMAFAGTASAQDVEKAPNKLNDALAEAVNKSVEIAGEAKNFLAAEIPEVVRQLLMWKMAEAAVGIVTFSVLALVARRALNRYWAWMIEESCVDEPPVILWGLGWLGVWGLAFAQRSMICLG